MKQCRGHQNSVQALKALWIRALRSAAFEKEAGFEKDFDEKR